ncbi:hypothetical protein [Acinetobacter pittii]|uniref:hypothetical protein n=1 Tax=Acinetobacter pittii TaxID=48296 RepID=UPI0015803125|nr:hypothetical protein [Acinetobacter pittii]NUF45408.1 hypothetical protein [Acinetobacter pittii]
MTFGEYQTKFNSMAVKIKMINFKNEMIALFQNEEVTNLEIDSLLDKFIRLKISRYEAYNSLMEILREYEVIMVESNS